MTLRSDPFHCDISKIKKEWSLRRCCFAFLYCRTGYCNRASKFVELWIARLEVLWVSYRDL